MWKITSLFFFVITQHKEHFFQKARQSSKKSLETWRETVPEASLEWQQEKQYHWQANRGDWAQDRASWERSSNSRTSTWGVSTADIYTVSGLCQHDRSAADSTNSSPTSGNFLQNKDPNDARLKCWHLSESTLFSSHIFRLRAGSRTLSSDSFSVWD